MKLTDFSECDNIETIHIPIIAGENADAVRVYCRQCGNEWRIGKDNNAAPEKELWSMLFFEDAVQPPHPLFYKLHLEQVTSL